MMKPKDSINICFCSDKNLTKYLHIVLSSILSKNSHYRINIHYIIDFNESEDLDKLKMFVKKLGNVKLFIYHKKWSHSYSGLEHVTAATMLRLFIPNIIHSNKIIYLDIDLIVNCDLMPLYRMNCGPKGIALKNSLLSSYQLSKVNTKSGNAGVMVMDLKKLRRLKFTEKCMDIFNDPSLNKGIHHDQHIINVFCSGKHATLPSKYNIFAGQDDQLSTDHINFIYHFVGSRKPYNSVPSACSTLWDHYDNSIEDQINKIDKINHFKNKFKHFDFGVQGANSKIINFGIILAKNPTNKYCSSNLGDYIESLAVINIYKKIVEKIKGKKYSNILFLNLIMDNKISGFNFVFIKRDNMSDPTQYMGLENVITVMSGWWMHPLSPEGDIDFNIPSNVIPIFTSIHLSNKKLLSSQCIETLSRYGNIGCRDDYTLNLLKEHNVSCFLSGGISSSIDFFEWENSSNQILYVDTKKDLSYGYKKTHNHQELKKLNPRDCLSKALLYLKLYSNSKFVKTSKVQPFLACMSMGVPSTLTAPDGSLFNDSFVSNPKINFHMNFNYDKSEFYSLRYTVLSTTVESILNNIKNIQIN